MTGTITRTATAARRQPLVLIANPAPGRDYRVGWVGTLGDGTRLTVSLVPDRQLLAPTAFAGYLERLATVDWPSLEALVAAVLDDFSNELVPRWLRVAGARTCGLTCHSVEAEDRQPDWNNPGLLARFVPWRPEG